MAAEPDDSDVKTPKSSPHKRTPSPEAAAAPADEPVTDDDEEDDDEEDGVDDEPRLKYTRLTDNLGSVYRNGDATSAFTVAGDKLVVGTHNGNIHVISIPSLKPVRYYHVHSASVSSVSVSPLLPIASYMRPDSTTSWGSDDQGSSQTASATSAATASPRTPKQAPVPNIPSNQIYIATSSIDGHVCVASLVDPKDVTLRNFARPVQAVALSPDYKADRTYLSGGLAGNLILTVGGRAGVSANANTNSAAAAASGWLGSIGLGSNTGKDTILHSGEGTISTIQWSLSGKFVMWANEQGIKIMRTNLHLENADSEFAWKRIGHIDRPNRRAWEEMAGVWRARAQWIDEKCLESDTDDIVSSNGVEPDSEPKENGRSILGLGKTTKSKKKGKSEKLVVGWGDTAWVILVNPGGAGTGREVGERSAGSVDIVNILRFEDCIISGLSLYTPSLLLVLAYRTRDDDDNPIPTTSTPRRHRQNGLQPELKLIHSETGDEIEVDQLTVSRFESLSAQDYHLSTIYVPQPKAPTPAQRGALEAIGIGGLWDASVNATRIFGSGASVASLSGSGDNIKPTPSVASMNATQGSVASKKRLDLLPAATSTGLKIFIQSPYDCVLAVKRDLSDHLQWVLDHENYKEAYELLDEHPEVMTYTSDRPISETTPTITPLKAQPSLVDFFMDDAASQTTISAARQHNSAVEKEKRRIGDLWVQQLVAANNWAEAGAVAGRVLGTAPQWEHWVLKFAQSGHFKEITPHIPTKGLKPPISSWIYELVLGHYIVHDRPRLKELLESWDLDLFDMQSVIDAIKNRLQAGDVNENSIEGGERGRDWRILEECLAKLYISDGRLRDALSCFIRLQNADAAMSLIREHHNLFEAVRDDIPGFLLLRVSKEQLDSAPLSELEDESSEAVHLLVDEAYEGIIRPNDVVTQLQQKGLLFQPFLFFYFQALWKGEGPEKDFEKGTQRMVTEGKSLVEEFGDLVVDLFAEYDRPLLMEFLRSSTSYAFEKASAVCENRDYIPELVYLLSKTGQTKRALYLIIDKIGDVSMAISFAKEQDDPDLWDDLLDYSMDKPRFIRGLLEEVGTSIDPIKLVKRIPEGLEIEGLREGIHRMIREYEIQFSISEGVAKVLRGEVAMGMETLRAGQKRGVKFEVVHESQDEVEVFVEQPAAGAETSVFPAEDKPVKPKQEEPKPGYCVGCAKAFIEEEKEPLIGFACGHVYHLTCLLAMRNSDEDEGDKSAAIAQRLTSQYASTDEGGIYSSRSVGAKVAHAHIIRNAIRGRCPECSGKEE